MTIGTDLDFACPVPQSSVSELANLGQRLIGPRHPSAPELLRRMDANPRVLARIKGADSSMCAFSGGRHLLQRSGFVPVIPTSDIWMCSMDRVQSRLSELAQRVGCSCPTGTASWTRPKPTRPAGGET